ncbi:uncharacterized protein KY384_009172 [Bacidia gigantensis]|uniref:uncharacterized protein n=1 Tax=Bacidia gigantensis TaxID=2732470 RepID=UPI001D04F55E|nr:uncharacterized protein KY384_009172 [Bacidia gigantensis]KAG8525528.1 hypothetical protein KY384_009172 [Bacidia gigantensis]
MTDDAPPDSVESALIDQTRADDRRRREQSEWRQFYEQRPVSDHETEIKALDIAKGELLRAWRQLNQKLPTDQQVQFAKRAPDINDVILVVRKIEENWQQEKAKGKFGRLKISFRKVCSGLGSHSAMLDVLPSSSQYVSVFCGSLQTLIQASMNYERIAEGLSRALEEITDAVDACVKEVTLYPTIAMKRSIANLYAHVFLFMRRTIEWYLKRSFSRTLSSLNDNYYDQFQAEISNVTRFSEIIKREAQLGSGAEIRTTRLALDHFVEKYNQDRDSDSRVREQERFQVLALEKFKKLEAMSERLGEFAQTFLKDSARSVCLGRSSTTHLSQGTVSRPKSAQILTAADNPTVSGREAMQLFSRHLEDNFDTERTFPYYDLAETSLFDGQIVSALQEWTTAPASQVFCIVGSEHVVEPAPTALIASQYVHFAVQSKIPVISYFCTLPRLKHVPEQQTPESIALISLIYALIRQLIELLPFIMTESSDALSEQRFALLDGSYDSLDTALEILEDLLEQSPPMLLCVIDSFQLLDDRSTKRQLPLFLDSLRGHRQTKNVEGVSSDRLLKILFTTAGRSRCLLDSLSIEELLFAELSRPSRRPGRVSGGGRALSPGFFSDIGREDDVK